MFELIKSSKFDKWLGKLRDFRAKGKILVALKKVQTGNLGDHKSIGNEISEIRLDYGPGYRVYYSKRKKVILLLLIGGTKSSQQADIEKAKEVLSDWKTQNEE